MAVVLRAAVLAAGFMLAAMATPVHAASTSDCTSDNWAEGNLPTPGYICVEVERREVSGAADIIVRATRDAALPAEKADAIKSMLLDSAVKTLDYYQSLAPGHRMWNVTFMVHGAKLDDWATDVGKGEECFIEVSIPPEDKSGKTGPPTGPRTVAHELAHCLQLWWAKLQTAGDTRDAALWWLEGSAEYLSNAIFPSDSNMVTTIGIFDSKSPTTPITQMAYETYVFFCWFVQKNDGVAAIIEFWDKMAKAPGESAQRSALLAAIGAEDLNAFARDYVDGKITNANGSQIIGHALMGDPTYIEGDTDIQLSGKPFTIARGIVEFRSGEYAPMTTDSESPATLFAPGVNGGAWGGLPGEVVAACDKPVQFHYASFATASGDREIGIAANQKESLLGCVACAGLPEHDKCLAGTWMLDNDSVEALLKPGTDTCGQAGMVLVSGSIRFKFTSSGTQTMSMNDFWIFVSPCGNPMTTRVDMKGSQQGTWSTGSGGALRFCPKTGAIDFTTRTVISTPAGPMEDTQAFPGTLQPQEFIYQCQGDKLTVTAMGYGLKGQPLVWVFRKQ